MLVVAPEDDLWFLARLDDGYPSYDGGYGGWTDVERPGQVSATVFTGTTSTRMPLRLILGSWPLPPYLGITCEQQIRMLEGMARQPVGARRGDRPPLIELRGAIPHAYRRWFVDDVEWTDVVVENGVRVMARVTVMLKRYVSVEMVEVRSTRRRTPPTIRYKWRKGDDLRRVARRKMGVSEKHDVLVAARLIKRVNKIRDPRRLRPGTWIKIPRRVKER